jgi:DNA-binding SARP family transcriptional activator
VERPGRLHTTGSKIGSGIWGYAVLTCRLLGHVEVLSGGESICLGYPRQRSLLAILLIEVNRLVSAESLIDRIWQEDPPETARATLYADISRLRRALRRAPGVQVVRRSGGYLIEAEPATVDLHRFRDLVSRAQDGLDDRTTSALLAEGLALWRGEPFADLSNPWLKTVQASLNAERLEAILRRNDAELRLGRHAALLADLRTLSAAHPLNERVAAQLMLALHRSGHQAEALQHYQLIRRYLSSELGVDPGPRLQELHQRILSNSGELDAKATVRPAGHLPIPRHLPAYTPHFIGRKAEMKQLTRLLDTGTAGSRTAIISTVNGTAGIGKTTLAIHWAHHVADRFPDGQLYVNLRGFAPSRSPMPPSDAIGGFLDALGVPPERVPPDLDARAALYRSLLADRRMLVVLDNARDSDQVRPLLPGSGTCMVIVTSRDRLAGLVAEEGARPIILDPFSAEEGIDLLASRLGTEFIESERDTANTLLERCAGLPLALAIVAARMGTDRHLSLATLVGLLEDERARLEVLDSGDPATSVRAAFSWSYGCLDPATARVFRLFGLHPGPCASAPAVAALAGVGIGEARSALSVLARAHLVDEPVSGQFVLHDLLRVYAMERAETEESPGDRDTALRRLLTWYLHSADAADRLLVPRSQRVPLDAPPPLVHPLSFDDREAALAWFESERANVVPITQAAADAGHHDVACHFPAAIWGFLTLRKPWADWITTHRIGLDSAERTGDRLGEAYLRTALADAHRDLRRYEQAVSGFTEALALWRSVANRWGEAATLTLLGLAHRDARDYPGSTDCLSSALTIFREIGDSWGEGWALYDLGETEQRLGRLQEAVAHSERAREIFRETKDGWGEGWSLYNLGKIHQRAGDLPEAVDCLQQALDLFRHIGNQLGEASVLATIGATFDLAGRMAEARDFWQQALTIFDNLGAPQAAAIRTRLESSAVSRGERCV